MTNNGKLTLYFLDGSSNSDLFSYPLIHFCKLSLILKKLNQAVSDGLARMVEVIETKANIEVSKKRHGRGRSQSVSGRSRGSRVNEIKPPNSLSNVSQPNGQLQSSHHKVT